MGFSPAPALAWTTPCALRDHAAAGAAIEVLYVHLPFAAELETVAGVEAHEHLIRVAADTLRECLRNLACPFDVSRWPADDLVAWVVDSGGDSGQWPTNPESLDIALSSFLRDALGALKLPTQVRERLPELGVARHPMGLGQDPERAYARAVREAQRAACDPASRELQRSTQLMDLALQRREFEFHFQPIVDASAGRLIAFEALCRGTMDGLRFPDVIFGTAERTNRVWELGRVLRGFVGQSVLAAPSDTLMFVNVHPRDIDDPEFLEQALSAPMCRHAARIVLELTERAAIRDYQRVKGFFATLRRRGYRLAIDDLGSGYAGLTALAELEPEFIKFDMGLVRDLHLHPVKQRLIGRMHEFALEIGAQTISEGVECEQERDALLRTGCTAMQGYFFARPARDYPVVPLDKYTSPEPRTSCGT